MFERDSWIGRFVIACPLFLSCLGQASSGSESEDIALGAEDPLNHACALEDCTVIGARVQSLPRPTCPETEPSNDQACEQQNVSCTYGDSASSMCRRFYQCSDGRWTTHANRSMDCNLPPLGFCPEQPSPSAECIVGESDVFLPCGYSSGVTCYCLGNPVGVKGAQGVWDCFGPPPNAECPELLPNIGEGCRTTAQFCRYGVVEEGCHAPYASVYCYQGAWEISPQSCSL
jgi:hypothetical protein